MSEKGNFKIHSQVKILMVSVKRTQKKMWIKRGAAFNQKKSYNRVPKRIYME